MKTLAAQPATVALFISDLHLAPSRLQTTKAFLDFMRTRANVAQKLFILGDLFDAWAGDDDLESPFNLQIVRAIRSVSDAGTEVSWIAGNRDFLVGEAFGHATGARMLADPHVTDIVGKRLVLTHGDTLCTEDLAYLEFRAKVRQPEAQRQFLALPLAQRKAMIEGMRADSIKAQSEKQENIMDASASAIAALFAKTGATVMVHGHTHRPHRHDSADGKLVRYVLPDWDCECKPERGGCVAMYADGSFRRFDLDGRMITSYT